MSFARLYQDLRAQAESHGIRVREERLDPETAGKFDGLSITLNSEYDPEESCYYLVHALASIVAWSLDPQGSRALFEELRAARAERGSDPQRLERAIERYRAFEILVSEYAVWLLEQRGARTVIPSYTNFFRADLEALTEFQRRGVAPVWRTFLAKWNEGVARGETKVLPFAPRPVPPFRPVEIEPQSVLQEEDGCP